MRKLQRLISLAQFACHQRFVGFDVPDEPHLDPETLEWLKVHLPKAVSYLEFGSGGSTRMASRFGVPTVSVECDRYFARAVERGLAHPECVTILNVDIGMTGPWGVPFFGSPTQKRVARWRNYVEKPFELFHRGDREFPELILIDGRFRRACALKSAQEAALAGANPVILLDDYFNNSSRSYTALEDQLGSPEKIGRSAIFRPDPKLSIDDELIVEAMGDFR